MWKERFIEILSSLKPDMVQLEQVFTEKNRDLPGLLFKYRRIDPHSLKNLTDDTIWLADPFDFNDPFDSALGIDFQLQFDNFSNLTAAELATMAATSGLVDRDTSLALATGADGLQKLIRSLLEKEPSLSPDKYDEFISALLEIFRKQSSSMVDRTMAIVRRSLKLCAFSELKDSILMWSHYANDHQGMCLEYPIHALPASDIRRRMLFPVVYTDTLLDCTHIFTEMLTEKLPNNLFPLAACLCKSTQWHYEKEWRLVFPGGIFPAATAYPMPRPSAVFLGAKAPDVNRRVVMEIAASKGIPVFQMSISKSGFVLEATPTT